MTQGVSQKEVIQREEWAKLMRDGAIIIMTPTFSGNVKPLSVEMSEQLALYLQENGLCVRHFPPEADL
jgi:hypothetical protein